jgi:hypothetical protein
MMELIQRLANTQPFQPFTIVTSGGMRYRVASHEHIGFNPSRTRVIVFFDDEGQVTVSALHITSVEEGVERQAA